MVVAKLHIPEAPLQTFFIGLHGLMTSHVLQKNFVSYPPVAQTKISGISRFFCLGSP